MSGRPGVIHTAFAAEGRSTWNTRPSSGRARPAAGATGAQRSGRGRRGVRCASIGRHEPSLRLSASARDRSVGGSVAAASGRRDPSPGRPAEKPAGWNATAVRGPGGPNGLARTLDGRGLCLARRSGHPRGRVGIRLRLPEVPNVTAARAPCGRSGRAAGRHQPRSTWNLEAPRGNYLKNRRRAQARSTGGHCPEGVPRGTSVLTSGRATIGRLAIGAQRFGRGSDALTFGRATIGGPRRRRAAIREGGATRPMRRPQTRRRDPRAARAAGRA